MSLLIFHLGYYKREVCQWSDYISVAQDEDQRLSVQQARLRKMLTEQGENLEESRLKGQIP
ncbi:MAG: hypothetical protein D5R98_06445 [Desulfonatronovibrio sp. MSAO_Bac4]|nr:MAG: hypothetical protein D5R98_06445 [Desulfonatronovibrio sp. MSAO_Bac4]